MNEIFKQLSYSEIAGRVFTSKSCGDFVVRRYVNTENVDVEFLATGTVVKTTKATVLKHRPGIRDPMHKTVFGVGCIGIGHHKAHHKGADTKPYATWRAMLRRCYYRGDGVPRSCYDSVVVCEDWHNFQNFAQWFEENYPNDGGRYELDKDVRSDSRTYGPSTCVFLSKRENLAARRFHR